MTVAHRVRVAAALWAVWAIVAWNVVFDRVLVLAGRRYIYAAAAADQGSGPYLLIKDWMGPAVTRGLWTATAAAGAILGVGISLIVVAVRREASRAGPQGSQDSRGSTTTTLGHSMSSANPVNSAM